MSQTSISGYFPVKKRRDGNHASIKRRKLTESSRLDIPVLGNSTDTASVPLTEPVKVTLQPPPAPSKKRQLSKRRQTSVRKTRARGQQSLQVLFEAVSKESKDQAKPEECEEINKRQDNEPTLSEAPPSLDKEHCDTEEGAVQISPCSDTINRLSAMKPHPQAHMTTPPSSRGAELLRLAQLKSPTKTGQVTQFQSRTEMVQEMKRLSARELALPTPHEKKKPAPKMKEFRTLEIHSPTKSSSRAPAYKRYQSLAEPTTGPELPLPSSYQLLGEKFRCTDTVVSMLSKRREIVTFNKLKRAAQEMSRRDFEQGNLAQMKTVYPTAFTFRQERNIPGSYESGYQLTVEANKEEPLNNPADLITRRKKFQQGLLTLVREHHRAFLSSLKPPLSIPEDKVQRWHPEFKLDELPEVPEADLPHPPLKESYSGAADVLKAAQGRLAPRVAAALANASRETTPTSSEVTPTSTSSDPSLKGVSQALLDKIRAKEAAKAKATITRDPDKEKRLDMMARLPEFVRILRCLFVGEKKAALPWESVISKLGDSALSRLSPESVGDHVICLTELAPSWIQLVTIKKTRYVKVDKKANLKALLELIQQTENKLKH